MKENMDKLTLEGLKHLISTYGDYRIMASRQPANRDDVDVAWIEVCDYASRLIAQSAQEAMSDEQERAAFEAWAVTTHGKHTLSDPDAGSMWSAWQARAILASKKETP